MADDNDNPNDFEADWRAWFDQWRDAIGATQGAYAASPWPVLTEAVWEAIQSSNDDDHDALAERLREGVREWRNDLRDNLPSAGWLTHTLLALTRLPAPHGPGGGISGGVYTEFASLPRLGPLQHHQARLEALHSALEAYQEALASYLDQLAGMAETSVDALERALVEDTTLDPSNARALFDRWCQLAEQEYENQLASDDYTQAVGNLTNRWSELQLALQPVIDDWVETLGMPSQRGLNETQAALDRLRRQHKAETRALRERLAALEARLESSDRGPSDAGDDNALRDPSRGAG